MEELIQQFKLPTYIKGKSFSEASTMIMKKFEERKDPASKRTMDELMGRLKEAQEFVKQQSEPQQPQQQEVIQQEPIQNQQQVDPMQQQGKLGVQGLQPQPMNQAKYGGILGNIKNNSVQNNENNKYENGGLLNLLNQNGLQDLMGSQQTSQIPEQLNQDDENDTSNVVGAISGVANTGMDFVNKAQGNNISTDSAKEGISGTLKGASAGAALGPLGAIGGGLIGGITSLIGSKKAKEEELGQKRDLIQGARSKSLNTFDMGGKIMSSNKYVSGGLLKPLNPIETPQGVQYSNLESQQPLQGGYPNQVVNENNGILGKIGRGIGSGLSKTGEFLKNKSDILRYAPTALSALQALKTKPAEYESKDRLNSRYKPQQVDEAALQNLTREGFNSSAEALAGASGGSTSALRSNILGANLNRTKALSDAYLKSSDINRGENRAAQQFNLGVDKTNLQQSNLEQDINARNKGAYETQKSKGIASIGKDLGAIGKEGKYGKLIEKLTGYNQKGEYLLKPTFNKLDDAFDHYSKKLGEGKTFTYKGKKYSTNKKK
jgi:hypothetical protein